MYAGDPTQLEYILIKAVKAKCALPKTRCVNAMQHRAMHPVRRVIAFTHQRSSGLPPALNQSTRKHDAQEDDQAEIRVSHQDFCVHAEGCLECQRVQR